MDYEGFDVYEGGTPYCVYPLCPASPLSCLENGREACRDDPDYTGKSGSRDYVQEIQVSDAEPLERK